MLESYSGDMMEEVRSEHGEVLQAIEDRNPDLASRLAEQRRHPVEANKLLRSPHWAFDLHSLRSYFDDLAHANGFLTVRLILDHFAGLVSCRRKQFGGLQLFRLQCRYLSGGHLTRT